MIFPKGQSTILSKGIKENFTPVKFLLLGAEIIEQDSLIILFIIAVSRIKRFFS